jgi:hypothetical protein
MKATPDNIEILNEGEIFVFGSNLGGRHGKGAARTALAWGAKWGQASGLQGRTYGIPTKDAAVKRVLRLDEIKHYVDEFIRFARATPELTYLVTEVGCGLAGYSPKDIAPLFEQASYLPNIRLPRRFIRKIEQREAIATIMREEADPSLFTDPGTQRQQQ